MTVLFYRILSSYSKIMKYKNFCLLVVVYNLTFLFKFKKLAFTNKIFLNVHSKDIKIQFDAIGKPEYFT